MFITEIDEVVSRRRFFVERSAAAVPRAGAASGTRTRRTASPGDLLPGTLSSNVVAQLPRRTRQPRFTAGRRTASRLGNGHFRVSLYPSHSAGVPKTWRSAEWRRHVRRVGKTCSRSCGYVKILPIDRFLLHSGQVL